MSRITHLKVKIKTLTAEAAIIRKEEQRALANPKLHVLKRQDGRWDYYPVEENDDLTYAVNPAYMSLRKHRVGIVRDVARINLLAYGFLRGRSYARMESKTREAPDFTEVKKVAKRFSPAPWDADRWEAWLADAEAHLAAQVEARKEAA